MPDRLLPLLTYLDAHPAAEAHTWQEWQIAPVAGGANNLLFRASNGTNDYAVKFTVRDERDRAGREYAALSAIAEAGAAIAPRPVLLDRTGYRQPVVVQTWLPGAVRTAPPATPHDWQRLLDMYCQIHTITPARTAVALGNAVLNATSLAGGRALIQQQLVRLPTDEQPQSLRALLRWFERWSPPEWATSPRTLCRVDGNWRNFVEQPSAWLSVDWENSGWGDPAFEWADLVTHPAYVDLVDAPWPHLVALYAERMNDPTAPQRFAVYNVVMHVWWVVRWVRYMYEVPRRLDERLVERPPGWLDHAQTQHDRYLANAERLIATTD